MSATTRQNRIDLGHALAYVAFAAILLWAGYFFSGSLKVRWGVSALAIVGFAIYLGFSRTQRYFGVLLDDRQAPSLSKLQILAWTILILSAYSTAALWNASHGAEDALAISIPQELWAVMGISVTSFLGSPIIKNSKMAKNQLFVKDSPEEAKATDLFSGDEKGNHNRLDLGKIQMFLFTVVLVVAYATSIARMFFDHEQAASLVTGLPPLSESMVALLGISHGGYLGYKTISHSEKPETAPAAAPAPAPVPSQGQNNG